MSIFHIISCSHSRLSHWHSVGKTVKPFSILKIDLSPSVCPVASEKPRMALVPLSLPPSPLCTHFYAFVRRRVPDARRGGTGSTMSMVFSLPHWISPSTRGRFQFRDFHSHLTVSKKPRRRPMSLWFSGWPHSLGPSLPASARLAHAPPPAAASRPSVGFGT